MVTTWRASAAQAGTDQGEEKKQNKNRKTTRAHCHISPKMTICRYRGSKPDPLVNAPSGTGCRLSRIGLRMPSGMLCRRLLAGRTTGENDDHGDEMLKCQFLTHRLWPLYERFRTSFQF